MRTGKTGWLGAFLLFVILLSALSSVSGYSRSDNPNIQLTYKFVDKEEFDKSSCEEGKDFLVQVTPFSCTPAVVRSDLLEEQNVKVFCQLSATQINPLVDINEIKDISFLYDLPPEVLSINSYPARAVLGVRNKPNSPILDNIGYVVITLKQNPNESDMPEFVEGNLTVKLKYNAEEVFGFGKADFRLPELTDEDWKNGGFKSYGFWGGKGYLRVEDVEENSARVSVYDKNLKKISSTNLKKGKSSKAVTIPGFDFCSGDMKIKLNDLEDPDTRAKLKINNHPVELVKGEKFLDNKCIIERLKKEGLSQNVRIKCEGDNGRETFELMIEPRVTLNVSGKVSDFERGDNLFPVNKKNIFLGYVGEDFEGNAFIVPVVSPKQTKEEFLASYVAREIPAYVKSILSIGFGRKGKAIDAITSFGSIISTISRRAIFSTSGSHPMSFRTKGQEDSGFFKSINTKIRKTFEMNTRPTIEFVDFAGGSNLDLEGLEGESDEVEKFRTYYREAETGYRRVIQEYANEKYFLDDEATIDENAFYNLMVFANGLEQKRTLLELCREFRTNYPGSEKDLTMCENDFKFSSKEISTDYVSIGGQIKKIEFNGIVEPGFDEYGVEISIRDAGDYSGLIKVQKNQRVYLSDTEFIVLEEIKNERVVFNIEEVNQSGIEEEFVGYLKINSGETKIFGKNRYRLKVEKINLKKHAAVSIIPDITKTGTEADFSFKIGIEKRNFKLSPEQTREKIKELNETIKLFNEISENLGNVNKGLQTACLATGTILNVKNFFDNLGGKGIARQKVMRGNGGWFERCVDAVNQGTYGTQEECLIKNSDRIDRDVEKINGIIEKQDEDIKNIESRFVTSENFLGDKVVDTEKFITEYAPSVNNSLKRLENSIDCSDEEINIGEIGNSLSVEGWKNNNYRLTELREIDLNLRILKSTADDEIKKSSEEKLCSLFTEIKVNSDNFDERISSEEEFGVPVNIGGREALTEEIPISEDIRFNQVRDKFSNSRLIGENEFVQIYKNISNGKKYLLVLDGDYGVKDTYEIKGNELGELEDNPLKIGFRKIEAGHYKNEFKSSSGDKEPVVKYFETEPYKGFPALVPFDLENGWYAAMRQTLPTGGNIKTFDTSGRVNSFMLCNVGKNGIEEFNSGFGDDGCTGINSNTGQSYDQIHGLSEQESKELVTKAVNAIESASRSYSPGVREVIINDRKIKVGSPALDIPDIQCQDFMSPKECNLLFNLCDPVICPSSRCDLGGEYPVRDVVQSGIIGSLFLCLPNVKEGIAVPVCLTGIKAGLDYWNTHLKSYQQCLQTSLDTGQTVGICDQIHSIYMCEMFWKEAAPIANIVVQKTAELIAGENVRGGGEYLSVRDAFTRTQKSYDFFTQNYAGESSRIFRIRSTAEAGTEICKNFPSIVFPNSADLINSLSTAETPSPPQFSGRFDEIPHTDVTVPPISHYKVFYHIYAGENRGAYYNVFLRADPSSFYQDVKLTRVVASGFIPAGKYATDSPDFQAPKGYRELCINVNGQEECGFREVSTSFAVDYVKDKFLESQASQTQITSEAECISGTIFGISSEIVSPEIYNRNIIRICATDDPGVGSDPFAKTEKSRWRDVGHCGNEKLRCFLDSESVEEVIKSTKVEGQVLEETANNYLDVLTKSEGFISHGGIDELIKKIDEEKNHTERINTIDSNLEKIFLFNAKGHLELLRADAYKNLTQGLFQGLRKGKSGRGEAKNQNGKIEDLVSEEGNQERYDDLSEENTGTDEVEQNNKICFKINEEKICEGEVKIFEDQDFEVLHNYNCEEELKYNIEKKKNLISPKIFEENVNLEKVSNELNNYDFEEDEKYVSLVVKSYCLNERIIESPKLILFYVPGRRIEGEPPLVERYSKFADFFDEYADNNKPERWSVNEFKALLVAIAHKESNFIIEDEDDLLMGYGFPLLDEEGVNYKTPERQIELASYDLKHAFLKDREERNEHTYFEYDKCDRHFSSKDGRIMCNLGVYIKINNQDKDEENINSEVNEIIGLKEIWEEYFKK